MSSALATRARPGQFSCGQFYVVCGSQAGCIHPSAVRAVSYTHVGPTTPHRPSRLGSYGSAGGAGGLPRNDGGTGRRSCIVDTHPGGKLYMYGGSAGQVAKKKKVEVLTLTLPSAGPDVCGPVP
eukprot:scaffold1007_cov364-Prasinococcus_capsulatus_cf.AAC.18